MSGEGFAYFRWRQQRVARCVSSGNTLAKCPYCDADWKVLQLHGANRVAAFGHDGYFIAGPFGRKESFES